MDKRTLLTLLTLFSGAVSINHLYDSFTRANSDSLGDSESSGPLGPATVHPWVAVSGDFDILDNAVVGGDAEANTVGTPGFEAGGTGGNFNGGAEIDDGASDDFVDWDEAGVNDGAGNKVEATATVHAGNVAVKLTRTTASTQIRQDIGTLTAGALYRAHVWTRGDGANAGVVRLESPPGTNLSVTATGVAGAVYAQINRMISVPDAGSSMRVAFTTPGGASVVYFDDAVFIACHAAYADAGVSDGVYTVNITTPAAGTDPFGLILRRSGATQILVVITPGTAGDDFALIGLNNGVRTSYATADIDWTADTNYEIAVTLDGASISVAVDSSEELSKADATLGQTNTQFGIWDSKEGNAKFLDVSIPV